MKKLCLLLICCLIAANASAQFPRTGSDIVSEKRFVTVITPGDPSPFLLNTTTGDLWKLDPEVSEWLFLGEARNAKTGPKGRYKLLPCKKGEVLILDTDTGETWWTDAVTWKNLERPRTRARRIN